MSRANVRVESRGSGNSRYERERSTTQLIRAFRRACNELGIRSRLNEIEFYEKPCEKRRRKKAKPKDLQKIVDKNGREADRRGW